MSGNGLGITLADIVRVVDPDNEEHVWFSQGDHSAIVFELKDGVFYTIKHDEPLLYTAAAELALEWRLEHSAP